MTTIAFVDIVNNPISAPPLLVNIVLKQRIIAGVTTGIVATLSAIGGVPGYTFAETGLPSGLSLNAATGDISVSGALTIGHTQFTAAATDSATNVSPTTTFTVDVHSNMIVQGTPPPGEHSVSGSYQFAVTGNTGAVTWALTTGPLPSGGSFSAGGLLSWNSATAPAKYPLTVTATDAGTGDTLDVSFILDIHAQFSMPGTGSGGRGADSVPVSIPCSVNVGTLSGVGPWKLTNVFVSAAWVSYAFNPGNNVGAASPGAVITVTGTPPASIYTLSSQQVLIMTFDITDAAIAHLATVQIYLTITNRPVPSLDPGNSLTVGSDNALFVAAPAAENRDITAGFTNGALPLTGTTSVDVWVPYDFTIKSWRMGGDGSSGSGTIDVLEATAGGYPSFTSITAMATPAVAGATQGHDSTLTAWTKIFTGGVWLRFTGSGFANWTRATLNLEVSTP